VTLAESDEGQFLIHVFKAHSLTPQQWRDMELRDRVFLMSAHAERNRRHNNQIEQSQRSAKHSQLRRR